ncbi:MAG: polymer-forming cytoskeletal protein [Sulfurihydrogenibium sp.]|jgi:cytoskeletal protein CcmA (bactofilin family)|nr:polymer-forming cytoskeletal protein [Sulfurihydrogenibium sp.]
MHEIILITGLFFMLLLLPFIFPFAELFLKKDAKPISIDVERKKEPDYFGKSFINLLTTALNNLKIQEVEKLSPVYLKLKLNREEWIGFLNDEKLLENTMDIPIVFTKDAVFYQNYTFKKELVVFGNAVFKNACRMRSLYVKGDCIIDAPIYITRWMHVEGTLLINSYADLGVSVYARKIKIRSRATFRRAFAQEITTSDKSIDNVKLIINGNIFRDDDIEIEGNVWIKGNVFSQGIIVIRNGVIIGEEGKIKSLVARDEIFIGGAFKIYGYIHSEKQVEIIL